MTDRSNRKKRFPLGVALMVLGIIGIGIASYFIIPGVLTRGRYEELSAAAQTNDSEIMPLGEEPYYDPIDWETLKSQNGDTVGWIKMDGTVIDYPVVRGETNESYLKRNFWGDYDENGVPYLDYRAEPDGRNVVIFGHHMGSTTVMFSELYDTYKQERFDAYAGSTVYWYTPTLHEQKFTPVAANSVYKDYEPVQWFFWVPTKAQISEVLRELASSKVEQGFYNESLEVELPDASDYSMDDIRSRVPVIAGEYDVAIADVERTTGQSVMVKYYKTGQADLEEAKAIAEDRAFHEWLHNMVDESSAKKDGWEELCANAERVLVLVCCSSPWGGQPYRNLLICVQ